MKIKVKIGVIKIKTNSDFSQIRACTTFWAMFYCPSKDSVFSSVRSSMMQFSCRRKDNPNLLHSRDSFAFGAVVADRDGLVEKHLEFASVCVCVNVCVCVCVCVCVYVCVCV